MCARHGVWILGGGDRGPALKELTGKGRCNRQAVCPVASPTIKQECMGCYSSLEVTGPGLQGAREPFPGRCTSVEI